jgi:hypothetical protein
MAEIDILLLAGLCCAIAVAVVLRRRRFVQVVSILIFLGAIWVSIFEMYTFGPRLAVSKHKDAGGKWSQDFRDGVRAARQINEPYYPYILISSFGLAAIFLFSYKAGPGKT